MSEKDNLDKLVRNRQEAALKVGLAVAEKHERKKELLTKYLKDNRIEERVQEMLDWYNDNKPPYLDTAFMQIKRSHTIWFCQWYTNYKTFGLFDNPKKFLHIDVEPVKATLPRIPTLDDKYRECWGFRTDNPYLTHDDFTAHTGMIEKEFFKMMQEFLVRWCRK